MEEGIAIMRKIIIIIHQSPQNTAMINTVAVNTLRRGMVKDIDREDEIHHIFHTTTEQLKENVRLKENILSLLPSFNLRDLRIKIIIKEEHLL